MSETRDIRCCGCEKLVTARLADGVEIYPHRSDLAKLPFWKCDGCGNFVGCHHKTKNKIKPLGVIPTPEIKRARQHIHRILDPLWKTGRMKRSDIYARLTRLLGRTYHTAEIRSVEEARDVWRYLKKIDLGITDQDIAETMPPEPG